MKKNYSVTERLFLGLMAIFVLSLGLVIIVKVKNSFKRIRVLPKSESVKIAKYLKDKYNKDFEVERADTVKLGLGVSNEIEANCISKDEDLTKFVTRRDDDGKYNYEDGYKETILDKKIKKELEEQIKELDQEAVFDVACGYSNPIEDIYNNNLDRSKLNISLEIAIPIGKTLIKEKYTDNIHNMLKKNYKQNNRHLSVHVKFYDKYYTEQVKKYYELSSISKTSRTSEQLGGAQLYTVAQECVLNELICSDIKEFQDDINYTKKLYIE